MKNLILLILVLTSLQLKAQLPVSVVSAPNLEGMTATNVAVQQKNLIQTIQSQLNTLNTSKNTLDNLEKIKEIDARITKVSSTLKQARVVYNIFKVGSELLKNAYQTNTLLNKNNSGLNKKYADRYLTTLQTTVDEADNIVAVCKDIISEKYIMNDYERLTLLNTYYNKMQSANDRVKRINNSFIDIVALNTL